MLHRRFHLGYKDIIVAALFSCIYYPDIHLVRLRKTQENLYQHDRLAGLQPMQTPHCLSEVDQMKYNINGNMIFRILMR